MNHPIYDEALAVIGHVIETSAFVFVSDRDGNTVYFYNKIHDSTYNVMGQLLTKGNRAVALLKDASLAPSTGDPSLVDPA